MIKMQNILICGNGSVGQAWGQICTENGMSVSFYDPQKDIIPAAQHFDIIHFMFPLTNKYHYLQECYKILDRFNAKLWIVNATIVPGVLRKLVEYKKSQITLYYSPMRGRESEMLQDSRNLVKFISCVHTETDNELVNKYYWNLKMDMLWFGDYEALVVGKLLEVAWFGYNIAFCQMAKLIADDERIDFDEMYTKYTRNSRIGKDYTQAKLEYLPRPVFTPGFIGGKCVIQDIDLLDQASLGDHDVWQWIKQQNELFRRP